MRSECFMSCIVYKITKEQLVDHAIWSGKFLHLSLCAAFIAYSTSIYSTSQKFGHTYSFKGISLLDFLKTIFYIVE